MPQRLGDPPWITVLALQGEQLDQSVSKAKIDVYHGHKRVHGIKLKSVALTVGIVGDIHGPVGQRNGILNDL